MVAMKRTVLALSLLWVLAGTAPASAAFLGENPRLGESFLDTTFLRVTADVSRELPPGSGGSCLERPAECFVAPGETGWPGSDPAQAPPGTEWRGQPGSTPGSSQGNYFNPETGESFRPDLNHPDPIGPHWDYRAPDGTWYRIMPDGTRVPK
jgi:hypothetical protein